MDNFTFCAPTYFAFGRDAELETGELIKKFGGSRVLLHYGGGSIKKNGAYEAVTGALHRAGIFLQELGDVKPNPRASLVYEGIALCRKYDLDFILAVGGGSAIDSAKAIAAGVPYEGDFWDFYCGKAYPEKALPVGTVLTIAAAGSEGSGNSVITKEEGRLKRGLKTNILRPAFSVLNPAFTCTLPPYQTACGITDIMVHVMERYFTNTKDVEVTDNLCEAILKTVITEAPRVMKDPGDYEARASLMWAGMLAHNNICGVGREQDWACHKLEHEVSAFYDVAHGAGLAVLSPAWMRYVRKQDTGRFVRFAVKVWGVLPDGEEPEEIAREGIRRWRRFLDSIGMPSTLKELGVKKEDIPRMVENSGFSDDNPAGFFVKLGTKDMEAIYESCYE